MPFKSYSEMRAMFRKDPAQAEKFMQDAKEQGKPVVSKNNPGYSSTNFSGAAKRRMKTMQMAKKEEPSAEKNKDRTKFSY